MIELEKTYLAKYLPEGLDNFSKKEIIDIYLPKNSKHSKLRIRKNGEKYEMTKKEPISGDTSKQMEYTIPLTEDEFESLKMVEGKKVHKIRYCSEYFGYKCEVDVFQDNLKGLVLVDFEFKNEHEKNIFISPPFCLVEITKEESLAGGMLCGKSYSDIENILSDYNYSKIFYNGF